MKVKLIKEYKLMHLVKKVGTVLTVQKDFGKELIEKGYAEEVKPKEEKKTLKK